CSRGFITTVVDWYFDVW
nr:immunoglobulin heavy chain junction region [Mus musculus]